MGDLGSCSCHDSAVARYHFIYHERPRGCSIVQNETFPHAPGRSLAPTPWLFTSHKLPRLFELLILRGQAFNLCLQFNVLSGGFLAYIEEAKE